MRFEANATYMVTATVHEPEGQRDFKERFGTLAKALDRALELRDTTRPAGGPGRRSVIFVDRQRRGNSRDLHLALSATSRTWGIESSSLEAQEILGSEIHRQVGPSEEWSGPSLPEGFDGFEAEDVFQKNIGENAIPICRLCPGGNWVYELRPGSYACQRHGWNAPIRLMDASRCSVCGGPVVMYLDPKHPKSETFWQHDNSSGWYAGRQMDHTAEVGETEPQSAPRRYERNRSSIEAAREIRRKFHDKDPQQEKPVTWQWPSEMQEIGTCEAVMYASNKWQSNPNKIIDYKHVAEGPQRILVREGFVRDHRSSKPLRVVGPLHELNDMPDAFAVLDRILGVQVRMYEGTDERPRLPDGDDGYFQIDIPNAYLGAARHPETDQTFLVVYSNEGVHCVIVGDELNVEKDGIVG